MLSYLEKDDLVKVLRNLTHAYYTFQVLKEGHYLRCSYSSLDSAMTEFVDDPVLCEFLEWALPRAPQVLGLSLLAESQLPFAILIARILKSTAPHLRVVAGGAYVTEILTEPLRAARPLFHYFDYLVAQEGESALANLLEAFERGRAPDHPNIFTVDNLQPRPLRIEPIEALPPPDFTGFDLSAYITPDLSLPVYASKGCTWGRCKFCSQNSLSYREKTVEAFLKDVRCVIDRTAVTHFQIVDENITPVRLEQLARQMLAYGPSIRWFVQVRLDRHLSASILELMRRAGCYAIEFGLESGNPVVLRNIRKGIVLDEVRRILRDCAALDYGVILNCMVGFPGETAQMAEESVRFLDSIAEELPHLRLTCNTQAVKIYNTSRYATSGEVRSRSYPLSTTMEWASPDWLPQFRSRFRKHLMFSDQLRTALPIERYATPPAGRDPEFALPQGCCFLENVGFDFAANRPASSPRAYLVVATRDDGSQSLFQLNEVMSSLIRELHGGRTPLSCLRDRFAKRYAGYNACDVANTFRDGMLRLNEIGALALC